MIKMLFDYDKSSALKILCLGAHSDDIEIGCGGTILKLISQFNKNLEIVWVVLSANDSREQEAVKSFNSYLRTIEQKKLNIYHFRDAYFPFFGVDIKETFESVKKGFSPDIVFTHYREDRHQDHRLVSDLTWNTFRDHLILEYEIPKYDGDFGSPNFFVTLDEKICKRKNNHVIKHFQTQKEKHWLTEETLSSVLRLRGIESGRSSRYAEAFYCRKLSL